MTADPRLFDAQLSAEEHDSLWRDVAELGQHLLARLKPGPEAFARPGPVSVAEARAAMERGQAVQLRYSFGGEQYVDTLMPLSGGRTRLVRTTLPDPPSRG